MCSVASQGDRKHTLSGSPIQSILTPAAFPANEVSGKSSTEKGVVGKRQHMPLRVERRIRSALASLTGLASMCLPDRGDGHSAFLKGLECPST